GVADVDAQLLGREAARLEHVRQLAPGVGVDRAVVEHPVDGLTGPQDAHLRDPRLDHVDRRAGGAARHEAEYTQRENQAARHGALRGAGGDASERPPATSIVVTPYSRNARSAGSTATRSSTRSASGATSSGMSRAAFSS